MRPHGTPKALEQRRRRAIALLEQGLSLNEVARRIGCHASSVMRWRNVVDEAGTKGLEPKPVPGRPPKLQAKQKTKLIQALLKGAMAHGYRTDLWTTQRIADLIQKQFGVKYHKDHVGRLMHELGWSHQKPQRRASERREKDIEQWTREEWSRVKKTPHGWAPTSRFSMNQASC